MGRKGIKIEKGERYERLVVTGKTIRKRHNLLWECKCDCGNIIYVTASDLKRCHTKSCGKCQDKAYNTGLNYLYGSYKRGAIHRNLTFNISKEQFNEIINQKCYYCGFSPNQILYKKGMQTPFIYNGIDRKDNTVGYEINNVVPACKFCNMAKGTSTINEFENWINHLVEYKTGNVNKIMVSQKEQNI